MEYLIIGAVAIGVWELILGERAKRCRHYDLKDTPILFRGYL